MWGNKPKPGPQDEGLCVTFALRVSDSSQYRLQPLTLSIFNFQLGNAAAWLEQRGEIAWRISGWGDAKLLRRCFQKGKGMKHEGVSKRNWFDLSFEDHSAFH